MLEVQGLSKRYGKYLAVDHVSFSIPDDCVGILLDRMERENPQL